ncbi:MAG: hypothetical protein IH886_16405 [Nitrospinae bacterium]|nr:hypothetical protein [Nitrospinota bacterium]
MKKIILLAAAFLFIAPIPSFAEKHHDMAGIQFKTLNGWTPSVKGFTVAIEHKDKNSIAMVTHIPYPAHGRGLQGVKGIVAEAGNHILKNSVETKLILQEFDRGLLKGYYFFLTDKEDTPGEFKYIKQGAVMSSQFYLTFTILFKDPHDPSEEALEIISSMRPSKRKPINIFPLIIGPKEVPGGFKAGGMSPGGNPRCHSRQPTFYYSVISEDEKLDPALKLDFKFYQSFSDNKKRSANLLFMQLANTERGVPFVKSLIWGNEMRPTPNHPERIFVKNNVLIVLCIKPGDEKVYSWIIKKYS